MARTKIDRDAPRRRQKGARLTWTRFHLPREKQWPTWSEPYSKSYLGPLKDVEGYTKVWVGRKVEDPEQAAMIIYWQSSDALKKFQDSPVCDVFLKDLPENDVKVSLLSGALLQDLSLNQVDGSKPSSAPPRILSFQWETGFDFSKELHGRTTFTALSMSYTGVPNRKPLRDVVLGAFNGFFPADCDDMRPRPVHNPNPRLRLGLYRERLPWMYSQTAWVWMDTGENWVDADPEQLEQQGATVENSGGQMLFCQFRRWNGYNGATAEREEASANNPEARESWAQVVGNTMPPVTAWEQERWDLEAVPKTKEGKEEEEEEVDGDEGNDDDAE